MRKTLRFLSLLLSAILMFSISVYSKEVSQIVKLSDINILAGDSGEITITTENFESFVGGFNFEIKFPEIVKITDLYLGETKLTSLKDGGSDYNVRTDNTLVLAGTCNYSDESDLNDDTVYIVKFKIDAEASFGEYNVEFTEDTFIIDDENDEELISPTIINGKINVIKPAGLKADIDESGKADAGDISILRKYLLDTFSDEVFNETAADINADSIIDIKDLVAIKKYFVRSVVYLSDNGDDKNIGDNPSLPVATLNRAIEQVYEGGTVYITDNYTMSNDFSWKNHFKSVEISGGVINATEVSKFEIGDNVTFTATSLNFNSGTEIFANGYALKINEDVSVTGNPYLYGGSAKTSVESTNLEIYGGSYERIFGGGKATNVIGDTNVIVGGNVNSSLNVADHDGGVYIVGGGNNGIVGGNTNLTVQDNAKSTYVVGAGLGAFSNVVCESKLDIKGGDFMGAYGGSFSGNCSGVELTISGGSIEQIFGGSYNASITGDVAINVLGGTVTRRIYGGCYNGTSGLSFASNYHVIGKTTVFLSANANVTLDWVGTDGSKSDRGIFACSRYSSHFIDEDSTIIYEDLSAQTKFSSKLGQKANDLATSLISWPQAAKTITIQN